MKNTLFLLILLPLLAFGQETETLKTEAEAYLEIEKALEYPDTITELDLSGYRWILKINNFHDPLSTVDSKYFFN